MTITKKLREETVNGETVTAYASQDKFSDCWKYEIIVTREGQSVVNSFDITETARTTWKRKFDQIVSDLKR